MSRVPNLHHSVSISSQLTREWKAFWVGDFQKHHKLQGPRLDVSILLMVQKPCNSWDVKNPS